MISCPKCSSRTLVIDARVYGAGLPRRRRRCPKCDHRFTTVEIPLDRLDTQIEELLRWISQGADE